MAGKRISSNTKDHHKQQHHETRKRLKQHGLALAQVEGGHQRAEVPQRRSLLRHHHRQDRSQRRMHHLRRDARPSRSPRSQQLRDGTAGQLPDHPLSAERQGSGTYRMTVVLNTVVSYFRRHLPRQPEKQHQFRWSNQGVKERYK